MTDINNIKKLTPKEAETIIREIAKYGEIITGHHCFNQMDNRTYDTQDLENILINGKVTDNPEFDERYQNWKCRVEGQSIDGDLSIVITAIISRRQLFCITIIGD